jgi:hypothetical protein
LTMFRRVAQPALNPASRNREEHDLWTGLVLALVGLGMVLCGARHLTAVPTVAGGTAWETQLVKAYATGGLEYPKMEPPPPPKENEEDPARSAAAFEKWAKQAEEFKAPTWKVRVDTSAKTPCPT